MGRRIISSLSKCDMCSQRDGDLFTVGGLEVCKSCKKTLNQCDRVKTTDGPPKESAGFGPRWQVRKEF